MQIIHFNYYLSIDSLNGNKNTGISVKANILSKAINLIEILQLYRKKFK
jgi:hypothetical protein